MELFKSKDPNPSKFSRKFGKYYNHLIDQDFLLGRNPYEDFWTSATAKLPVNIREEEDHFELELPLPGWKKEDIKIEIVNDVLSVHGEKTEETEEMNSKYVRKEHKFDSFERSFKLHSITDQDKIEANLKDGMLYIKLHHHHSDPNQGPSKEIKIE